MLEVQSLLKTITCSTISKSELKDYNELRLYFSKREELLIMTNQSLPKLTYTGASKVQYLLFLKVNYKR